MNTVTPQCGRTGVHAFPTTVLTAHTAGEKMAAPVHASQEQHRG
jgi:hypothetical protein